MDSQLNDVTTKNYFNQNFYLDLYNLKFYDFLCKIRDEDQEFSNKIITNLQIDPWFKEWMSTFLHFLHESIQFGQFANKKKSTGSEGSGGIKESETLVSEIMEIGFANMPSACKEVFLEIKSLTLQLHKLYIETITGCAHDFYTLSSILNKSTLKNVNSKSQTVLNIEEFDNIVEVKAYLLFMLNNTNYYYLIEKDTFFNRNLKPFPIYHCSMFGLDENKLVANRVWGLFSLRNLENETSFITALFYNVENKNLTFENLEEREGVGKKFAIAIDKFCGNYTVYGLNKKSKKRVTGGSSKIKNGKVLSTEIEKQTAKTYADPNVATYDPTSTYDPITVDDPTSTYDPITVDNPTLKYDPTSTYNSTLKYDPTITYNPTKIDDPTLTYNSTLKYDPTSTYSSTSTYDPLDDSTKTLDSSLSTLTKVVDRKVAKKKDTKKKVANTKKKRQLEGKDGGSVDDDGVVVKSKRTKVEKLKSKNQIDNDSLNTSPNIFFSDNTIDAAKNNIMKILNN